VLIKIEMKELIIWRRKKFVLMDLKEIKLRIIKMDGIIPMMLEISDVTIMVEKLSNQISSLKSKLNLVERYPTFKKRNFVVFSCHRSSLKIYLFCSTLSLLNENFIDFQIFSFQLFCSTCSCSNQNF
jgi:hypothetical protein